MGRKIGATQAISNLSAPKAALITSQMHYLAIVGCRHAAAAFGEMEVLRKQKEPSPGEPRLKRKRPFTEGETEVIRRYFTTSIAEDKSPTLAACAKFVEEKLFARSPKDIQDKVKNLRKATHK